MKRLKILMTTILLAMILVSCSETDKQSFAGDRTEANDLVSEEVSETEAKKEEPTKEEPTKEEVTKEELQSEEAQTEEAQTEEAQTEELEETQEVENKNPKKEYKKTNDVKYAKSDVNIRKGPTSKYDKLGVLAKGQKVNRNWSY